MQAFQEAELMGSRTVAHWCACALAEWSLDERKINEARQWLAVADRFHRAFKQPDFFGGRMASWIRVALFESRPDDAEELLKTATSFFPAVSLPRFRAGAAAYRVQISRLRNQASSAEDLRILHRAYERGRWSLQFDEIMAALWHAQTRANRHEEASSQLTEYLAQRRPRMVLAAELKDIVDPVTTDELHRLGNQVGQGPTNLKKARSRRDTSTATAPTPPRSSEL